MRGNIRTKKNPGLNQAKAALRQDMRQRLASLRLEDQNRWSHATRDILSKKMKTAHVRVVMAFAAVKGEPDIMPLAWKWRSEGIRIALPRMVNSRIVPWALPRSPKELSRGAHGNLEPQSGHSLSVKSLDLCLVPGLAFSFQGHRLGRGGGHFDRFLSGLRANFWGVCFGLQVLEHVPSESRDVRMQGLVTEKGFRKCKA